MEISMIIRHLLIVLIALGTGHQALAAWSLDNASSYLTFVSTKAIDIGEAHRFTELTGRLSDKGKALVSVNLKSVDTNIPLRDQRLREMLFETDRFPQATVRARIDMELIKALAPGDSTRLDTELTLELHGKELVANANMVVSRLSESALTTSSTQPIILDASSVGLSNGIEKLRKVANLPSISNAVPVTFLLTFVKSQ